MGLARVAAIELATHGAPGPLPLWPFGFKHLADQGGEVFKIEPSGGGDVSRAAGPHFLGDHDSIFFQTFDRHKASLVLDLKSESGPC